jgi:hypothetical protein
MKRLLKKIVLSMCFIMFLLVSTSEAQAPPDLSLWNGTLWRITNAMAGCYFSDDAVNDFNGPDGVFDHTVVLWGIVTADMTGTFIVNIYSRDSGGNCTLYETLDLSYIAGSPLGFVATYEISETNNYSNGLLYVKGKLDSTGTELQSGNIETLGQYVKATNINVPLGGDRMAYRVINRGTKVKKIGCLF